MELATGLRFQCCIIDRKVVKAKVHLCVSICEFIGKKAEMVRQIGWLGCLKVVSRSALFPTRLSGVCLIGVPGQGFFVWPRPANRNRLVSILTYVLETSACRSQVHGGDPDHGFVWWDGLVHASCLMCWAVCGEGPVMGHHRYGNWWVIHWSLYNWCCDCLDNSTKESKFNSIQFKFVYFSTDYHEG